MKFHLLNGLAITKLSTAGNDRRHTLRHRSPAHAMRPPDLPGQHLRTIQVEEYNSNSSRKNNNNYMIVHILDI